MNVGARPRVAFREAIALARQGLLLPSGGPYLGGLPPAPHLTVFLHGYMAWPGVLAPLGAYLATRYGATRQLHFPYMPTGSVEEHARRLDARVRALWPSGPVHIVGHSLGGLVGRYYRQVLERRVDRLVCIATPHYGTHVARRWTSLPLAREIAPGSATVRLLDATRARLAGTRVCCIVGDADVMITPNASAVLAEHEAVSLPGVGHQAILFDSEAWANVGRVLTEPLSTAADGRDRAA